MWRHRGDYFRAISGSGAQWSRSQSLSSLQARRMRCQMTGISRRSHALTSLPPHLITTAPDTVATLQHIAARKKIALIRKSTPQWRQSWHAWCVGKTNSKKRTLVTVHVDLSLDDYQLFSQFYFTNSYIFPFEAWNHITNKLSKFQDFPRILKPRWTI